MKQKETKTNPTKKTVFAQKKGKQQQSNKVYFVA